MKKFMSFFSFNKSDRYALVFLIALSLLAFALIWWLGGQADQTVVSEQDSASQQRYRDSRGFGYGRDGYHRTSSGNRGGGREYRYDGLPQGRQIELFPFDPNRADSNQLMRLGFSPWQVRNIYKYRAKGGVYRAPEDLAQLYGMTKEQYETLRPYIRISDDFQPAARYVAPPPRYAKSPRDSVKYPTKIGLNEKVVLNTADTTQLKKVPGIGSGWARQIVSYGRLLGGYVDVAQLTEIEGFPKEALAYFVVQHPHTQKMNLNQLTLNQLRRHPYINFFQARAICDYRRLHGRLDNLNQLRLLSDFPPEAIQRLEPYVTY